jgi:hypothetical protein
VRLVWQIVDRENQSLGKTPILFFVSLCPLLHYLKNLLVRVGGCNLSLNLGAVELAFILKQIELLCSRLFVANLNFLSKKQCVQFQAADLLAYEHLKVNVQLGNRAPWIMGEDELRYPLKRLSEIPGGRIGVDWGVHMEDDMTESCIRQGIPLRSSS